jgi:hypothetical protein
VPRQVVDDPLAPYGTRPRLQAGIGCVTKATWSRGQALHTHRGHCQRYCMHALSSDTTQLLHPASQSRRVPLASTGICCWPLLPAHPLATAALDGRTCQAITRRASQPALPVVCRRLCCAESPRQRCSGRVCVVIVWAGEDVVTCLTVAELSATSLCWVLPLCLLM